jgi:hypothetical protein
MLPKWHVLIGFVISYILVYFFNLSLLAGAVIFLSSWLLVDFDHYLLYVIKNNDFDLSRAYLFFLQKRQSYIRLSQIKRKEFKKSILIFHGIEFWAILVILSFFNKIFLFVLIGIFIHMLFDWIDLYYIKESFYQKISQIYTFIKNKKLKEFVLK